MTFTEKYSKILSVVQEDIDKINLLDGIDIQEPLKSELCAILNAPSKHIRALVSFLYLRAICKKIDEFQINYQTSIELVHNASLIHDDVIDNSKIRRNKKTLNEQFDSKLAVISGDYLLSLAMKKVIEIGNIELVSMFCKTLKDMTEGEISQYFDKNKIPTIEQYINKSEKKTARLFQTALVGGVMLSGNNEFKNADLFAKNFGIAFQVRDDLINFETTKSDINDGIYTAPVIYSNGEDITDASIEKTKDLLNNYFDNAAKYLCNIEDNKYKLALLELVELLKNE